ncbi:MAG: TetR/AcrR family transcriptional regulator [Peptostreptococcaceae bacterium]
MFKTFENLDEDKKRRVIKSSIEEFANKGYKNATIDNIVSKAGISKGSIFQYFKNKKNLYLYICDYQINIITKEVFEKRNENETDFFELYRNASHIKYEILKVSPYTFKFFQTMYTDESEVAKSCLNNIIKNKAQIVMDFMGEYDRNKFRDDIDIDMAVKTVELTFDGLSMKWIDKLKNESYEEDLKVLFDEVDNYIDFYKKLYYKEV